MKQDSCCIAWVTIWALNRGLNSIMVPATIRNIMKLHTNFHIDRTFRQKKASHSQTVTAKHVLNKLLVHHWIDLITWNDILIIPLYSITNTFSLYIEKENKCVWKISEFDRLYMFNYFFGKFASIPLSSYPDCTSIKIYDDESKYMIKLYLFNKYLLKKHIQIKMT